MENRKKIERINKGKVDSLKKSTKLIKKKEREH